MKKRNGKTVVGILSVIGLSVFAGTAVMADGETEYITIPYEQENAWDEVAMTNDDTVETGVNIRATADDEGEVVGYLYQGGAAWVLKKGKEWTEICSGEITGFVKNEYLVYGRDAIGLADHYGLEGVATTWDDVSVFAGQGSDVIEVLKSGKYFELVEDAGHWLTVQYTADDTAYMSSDDVSKVLILETAVDKDAEYVAHPAGEWSIFGPKHEDADNGETSYEEPTYEEPTYQEPTYQEPTYEEPTYQEPTYTPPQTEAPKPPQTEAPQPPQTEAPQPPQTEAPSLDEGNDNYTDDDVYVDNSSDEGYYDADTDTYYDANGNPISGATKSYEASTAAEEYVPETETYVEETEAPQTEAAAATASDTDLLAALIYCEAGNQPYDGMVGVGAVVMNRVNSSSFPGSISEVIYQDGQFTPASSGGLASALANGVPSTCYDAAADALNGVNPVGSALYFNTGSGKGNKIGDHQFY